MHRVPIFPLTGFHDYLCLVSCAFIKTKKLTWVLHWELNYRPYYDVTSISTNIFSVSGPNRGCHIVFSYYFSLVTSNPWQYLGLTLHCMTLTLFKNTGQVFCRLFLYLGLSDIFSDKGYGFGGS